MMPSYARLLPILARYLRQTVRHDWRLLVLGLIGLAPGVATFLAWTNLALALPDRSSPQSLPGWLLPRLLLDALGVPSVLLGCGLVTLLIGCLGLTNVYLASLEARAHEFALLANLGMRNWEVRLMLGTEAILLGLLGSSVGVLGGIILSGLSWPAGRDFFQFDSPFSLSWHACLSAFIVGMVATLLFMGTMIRSVDLSPAILVRGRPSSPFNLRREMGTSLAGALIAAILALVAGLLILPQAAALLLTALTVVMALLLCIAGWTLTRLYRRLPISGQSPIWSLAVQGLARHPNHTAGLGLVLTACSYSVGLAALTWVESLYQQAHSVGFVLWVTGMMLLAGATLVLADASLAALERRREYAMLQALGARSWRIWRTILLEYGIVALGAGTLGALLALVNWVASAQIGDWWLVLAVIVVDIFGALFSAWIGAAPVLWLVTRRTLAEQIRGGN